METFSLSLREKNKKKKKKKVFFWLEAPDNSRPHTINTLKHMKKHMKNTTKKNTKTHTNTRLPTHIFGNFFKQKRLPPLGVCAFF
mmetsp:Transcript_635/g.969  ORF Transcript_635/g.969 Transcript_635/m.969 type:complete len:85 (-) Transcript_635:124-378(-)